MSFIGLDLGTSFIKAAVLDLDSVTLGHVRRVPFPEPIRGLAPTRVEFDPDAILSAVQEVLSGMSEHWGSCEGILMCTQMSCLIFIDNSGKVRSNCIGWRDQRAVEQHPSKHGTYHDVLLQRIGDKEKRELGNELPAGAPISFLFWFAEQNKLEKNLIPASLSEFVISTLCGSRPMVESTTAMSYELLKLSAMQWHHDVIHELGLGELQWPAIVPHGEIVGYMTLGNKPVPCYTAVGDYQCALAGALLDETELSLNISTGSQASRLTSKLSLGNYQTRPFFDGKFTNVLSHLPAGRSLNVLLQLITEFAEFQTSSSKDPWEYIVQSVDASPVSDLRVDLGFFPGPCGNQGGITNIRESNLSVGSLFKAAFENMAENYSTCAKRVWPDQSWSNLVFSGGVARKLKLLRGMIERKLQTSSRLCPLEEDSLLGLTALALFFSGRTKSVEAAMSTLRLHFAQHREALYRS